MKPSEYEQLVCEHYRQQGYRAFKTPDSGDYGVDVFAEKGKEKIAIQAKMYGDSSRKINRAAVMELYGAMVYFDCTNAVIVTNGEFLPDAIEVAQKLKIKTILFPKTISKQLVKNVQSEKKKPSSATHKQMSFDDIWEKYIIPLKGKSLCRENGKMNKILNVDWAGITRITSNGKEGHIKIEIFKWTIHQLLEKGEVSRDEINQNYTGRASSGVVLILSQVPFFQLYEKPIKLKLKGY